MPLFSVVLVALIVIVLIKHHKRNVHYDVSGKDPTSTVRTVGVKSIDEETNHECVFSNPTYQDAQDIDKSIAIEISVQLKD